LERNFFFGIAKLASTTGDSIYMPGGRNSKFEILKEDLTMKIVYSI